MDDYREEGIMVTTGYFKEITLLIIILEFFGVLFLSMLAWTIFAGSWTAFVFTVISGFVWLSVLQKGNQFDVFVFFHAIYDPNADAYVYNPKNKPHSNLTMRWIMF